MLRRVMLVLFGLLPMCSAANAEDAYFRIRLVDVKFTEGELPDYTVSLEDTRLWQRLHDMRLEVQLDESGEAYFQYHKSWGSVFDLVRADDRAALFLVIRAPEKRAVTGQLFLPKPDVSGLVGLKFRIPVDATTNESARQFQLGKIEHYERLLRNRGPGAAWFRRWDRPTRRPRTGDALRSDRDRDTGEPKLPDSPALLFPFAKTSFGLTFEIDGLRSRLELVREKE